MKFPLAGWLSPRFSPFKKGKSDHRRHARVRSLGTVGRLLACVVFACTFAVPTIVRADDPDVKFDARLDGYTPGVHIDDSGTALSWMLLVVLMLLGLGVFFKDAKRSHLD